MIGFLKSKIKALNHRRLKRRKEQRIQHLVQQCTNNPSFFNNEEKECPCDVSNILLFDTLGCFGDALFVNGLLKSIKETCPLLKISILTFPQFESIYSSHGFDVLHTTNEKHIRLVTDTKYDVVIDLAYTDEGDWDFRSKVLGTLDSFIIATSPKIKNAKIFSGYLNWTKTDLFGERMWLLLELLRSVGQLSKNLQNKEITFPHKTGMIYPYVDDYDIKSSQNWIYVNAAGRVDSRSLGLKQIKTIVTWFNNQVDYKGFLYLGDRTLPPEIKLTEKIQLVKPGNFSEACELIKKCKVVVSPDTAIVHVASSFNIPVIALYNQLPLEYLSGKPMLYTWKPLSEKCEILIARDGQVLSSIPGETIIKYLEKLLHKINV